MIDWKHLSENKLVIKIFALVAAIVLWLFVMQEQNPIIETNYTVDLTLAHIPVNCKISADTETVKLRIRAPRSLFGTFHRDELKAVADLGDLSDGKRTLRVNTTTPQGVEVISTKPETVEVSVEPIVMQTREVNFIRVGTLPDDMTVGSIAPEASAVTLTGSQRELDSVAQVVGYVSLTSQSPADVDLQVPLSPLNNGGKAVDGVHIAPDKIAVHVQLARGLSKKIVDVTPLFEGTLPEGYAIKGTRVTPSRIEIAGMATVLNGITALDTEPIPIANISHSVRKNALLMLPPDVTVTNRMVTVELTVERQ